MLCLRGPTHAWPSSIPLLLSSFGHKKLMPWNVMQCQWGQCQRLHCASNPKLLVLQSERDLVNMCKRVCVNWKKKICMRSSRSSHVKSIKQAPVCQLQISFLAWADSTVPVIVVFWPRSTHRTHRHSIKNIPPSHQSQIAASLFWQLPSQIAWSVWILWFFLKLFLHGIRSIGLGGHLHVYPNSQVHPGMTSLQDSKRLQRLLIEFTMIQPYAIYAYPPFRTMHEKGSHSSHHVSPNVSHQKCFRTCFTSFWRFLKTSSSKTQRFGFNEAFNEAEEADVYASSRSPGSCPAIASGEVQGTQGTECDLQNKQIFLEKFNTFLTHSNKI